MGTLVIFSNKPPSLLRYWHVHTVSVLATEWIVQSLLYAPILYGIDEGL